MIFIAHPLKVWGNSVNSNCQTTRCIAICKSIIQLYFGKQKEAKSPKIKGLEEGGKLEFFGNPGLNYVLRFLKGHSILSTSISQCFIFIYLPNLHTSSYWIHKIDEVLIRNGVANMVWNTSNVFLYIIYLEHQYSWRV